jgi:phosphopantetheine adenylyltransferase
MHIDVAKVPSALYGEVPTFLTEHPTKDAIFAIYNRMKTAQIAMSTSCMSVLLNDFKTRMQIELVNAKSADPWDICLHYFYFTPKMRRLKPENLHWTV